MTYMAALTLKGWFPKPVIDMLLSTTLGRATAWVATEAKKRTGAATKGGARGAPAAPAARSKCRWSWRKMRRVCEPVEPPATPANDAEPTISWRTIGVFVVSLAIGLAGLTFYC